MTRASIVKACNDGTVAILAAVAAAMITTMMLVKSIFTMILNLTMGTKPAMAEKGSQ